MIYVLFTCDNWHSNNSKEVFGVATTMKNAISMCKKKAKERGVKIDRDDIYNLERIKQTQGIEDDFELIIEEYEKNKLS